MVKHPANACPSIARRDTAWVVLLVLLIAIAVLKFVTWRPDFHFPDSPDMLNRLRIDISTTMLLPFWFERGIQFGKDVLFPYGPLGFLRFGKYHPATFTWMILGQSFLAAVFAAGCWNLVARDKGRVYAASMAFFAAVVILVLQSDALLQSFIILLVVTYFFSGQKPLTGPYALLVAACALVALVKVSALMLTLLVVFTVTTVDLLKRRTPWTLLLFTTAFLILWTLSGQHFSNIPAYVLSTSQLVSGYTEAMSFGAPEGTNLLEIMLYIASAGLFVLLIVFVVKPRRNRILVLPVGLLALFLFTVFKHSFVRHDGHAIEAAYMLSFFLFLVTALGSRYHIAPRARMLFFAFSALSLTTITVIMNHWLGFLPAGQEELANLKNKANLVSQASAISRLAVYGKKDLQQQYEAESEAIRRSSGIGDLGPSLDLYPDNLSIVAALQLPYSPRPGVMSHGAYTPVLARLNADHLKDANAPSDILFKVETIDGRYPPIDDGLSWPELWTRYRHVGVCGEYLHLRRINTPGQFVTTKVAELDAPFGQTLDVSSLRGGLVWAEIEIEPTPAGKLMKAVYKLPEVYMALQSGTGQVRGYRMIPGMLSAGFLLSPVVENGWDFVDIMNKRRNALQPSAQVTAVMFVVAHWGKSSSPAGRWYKDHIRIRLYRLDV